MVLFGGTVFFHRFNTWLNDDTYCDTVNEALSGNLRQLNGFLYISDGVKWHRNFQFQQWLIDIILNYVNGQVIVLISTLSNWSEILSNRKPKSKRELENAIDEALNDLSLNVVQACIKKTWKVYEQFVSSY